MQYRRFIFPFVLAIESQSVLAFRRRSKVPPVPFGGVPDEQLVVQTSITTACEAAALIGIVEGCKALAQHEKLPSFFRQKILGVGILQWSSLWIVVFGSGLVRAAIDGSLSAAGQQIINPNKTPDGSMEWYASLKKPWFTPPGWVFPIMWLIISKPTQLLALSRIVYDASWYHLIPYGLYTALGDSWNTVFFAYRRIQLGLYFICAFWLFLVAAAVVFGSIDRRAGMLMLPTLGWVTVATALNYEIYRMNARAKGFRSKKAWWSNK